jgi:hypothetical protein
MLSLIIQSWLEDNFSVILINVVIKFPYQENFFISIKIQLFAQQTNIIFRRIVFISQKIHFYLFIFAMFEIIFFY